MRKGAVSCVGALLPRELLDRVDKSDPKLAGTKAVDYGLVPGERTRDAVTRSWQRLTGVWASFGRAEAVLPDGDKTATALTRERWLLPLFDEMGFAGLSLVHSLAVGGRQQDLVGAPYKDYAISHEWADQVPVHLMGRRVDIDRRALGVRGAASASPHGLVQEFLNRSDQHLWGVVSNGRLLRILRDNASLTRQAYLEFDLEAIFDGDSFAEFALLWLCTHGTRFDGDPPQRCLLEQWSQDAAAAGTRARDKLRGGVEAAIVALGNGVLAHPANTVLRKRLRDGDLSPDELQRQLLRVIYRLLFLLVAESRDLLHNPGTDPDIKQRYERHYSMARLRRLAEHRRGGSHSDLWAGLQIIMSALDVDRSDSNAANRQQRTRSALGLVALGSFLWRAETASYISDAQVDNAHLLSAIRCLALVRDDEAKAYRQVDYRNLGTEELGSVYESLLELHAEADPDTRCFDFARVAGSERKTTGSYYTPPALISRLIDEALDPVIDEAAAQSDPEQALLGLKVLDPACGSGHFLIAAAYRIAARLARVREGDIEAGADKLRIAMREVVGHCIYGIDINPMAVELCKVSLWLESNIPGQPFGFLDHHIVCGNSLLGTTPKLLAEGIPDAAFKALPGGDRERIKLLRKANKAERRRRGQTLLELDWSVATGSSGLAAAVQDIDAGPEDTAEQVVAKEIEYARLRDSGPAVKAKLIADAWCAAFVTRKTPSDPPITDKTLRALQDRSQAQVVADIWSSRQDASKPEDAITAVDSIVRLADQYQFTHLHLTFPDVFEVHEDPADAGNEHSGWSAGFNVVLGNPPFLNQLRGHTVNERDVASLHQSRYEGLVDAYTDTAYLFFALSCGASRADSGRVGLVQPDSLLAANSAAALRKELSSRSTLQFLWVAGERVFDAQVLTCAVAVQCGCSGEPKRIRRARGATFESLPDLEMSRAELIRMPTWGPLIADGFGIPRVDLDQSRTMGEVLAATADFRDQYYGLAPFVEEADGRVPDGVSSAALVTTGLIDPADLLWGKRPTKFNKTDYNAPVVDLNRLRAGSDLGDWAAGRLVPKLLLATQTRAIEVVVDQSGMLLPSVPVITVTTDGIILWQAAAALMSPPVTAWAAARYMGAALSIDALKLSASQVHGLPLPPASAVWDRAAGLIRDASNSTSPELHREQLVEAGALMCDAYGILDSEELMTWWRNRLPEERSL